MMIDLTLVQKGWKPLLTAGWNVWIYTALANFTLAAVGFTTVVLVFCWSCLPKWCHNCHTGFLLELLTQMVSQLSYWFSVGVANPNGFTTVILVFCWSCLPKWALLSHSQTVLKDSKGWRTSILHEPLTMNDNSHEALHFTVSELTCRWIHQRSLCWLSAQVAFCTSGFLHKRLSHSGKSHAQLASEPNCCYGQWGKPQVLCELLIQYGGPQHRVGLRAKLLLSTTRDAVSSAWVASPKWWTPQNITLCSLWAKLLRSTPRAAAWTFCVSGPPKMVSAHRAVRQKAYPKWSVHTELWGKRPTQNGQCT